MLQSLHVKNLALMEETEVEFGPGLNILTGETGAGKSLLIGSVNLALGGKFDKEMLRKGTDYALVELTFVDDSPAVTEKLKSMELFDEETGCIIISRKMQAAKSVCRINGETVTARQIKELAEVLIDIHGQHEHQSLLKKQKHLEILDDYAKKRIEQPKERVKELYGQCKELRERLENESLDENAREKEKSLAEFELDEISEANLTPGEDEELEKKFRVMSNSRKIAECLSSSYRFTGNENEEGAGSSLSRGLRELRFVTQFDGRLEELEGQLSEIENLLSDYNRDVAEYLADCEFDPEEFAAVEDRLNTINRLKGKYGADIGEILDYAEQKRKYLERLSDYDNYISGLKNELEKAEQELDKACEKLSKIRKEEAKKLSKLLKEAMVNLNFLSVQFEISVKDGDHITASGADDVEFLISTNPGEPIMPLSAVASGGELSRIMLAIKTVMAGKDEIDTLIFDEIDSGISGKTAWKVSEQLDKVGHAHQVLCITHLPQIAAMADHHFMIEKSATADSTKTCVRKLAEEESLEELARLLGSDTLTKSAIDNAAQMRDQALKFKNYDVLE